MNPEDLAYRVVRERYEHAYSEVTEEWGYKYSIRHIWTYQGEIFSIGPIINLSEAGSVSEMIEYLDMMRQACDLPVIEEIDGKWVEVDDEDGLNP